MSTMAEKQNKINEVTDILASKVPSNLHEKMKEITEEAFSVEPFIHLMNNDVIAEKIFAIVEPAIVYDLGWDYGDTLVFDNGNRYKICYHDTIEYGANKAFLLHAESATLFKGKSSLRELKRYLKIEQEYFPKNNTIVKLEKKKKQ